MKRKMSILFLVISFLIPVFDAIGDEPHDFLADSDIAIDQELNHSLVLIDNNICKSIIELAQCIPHYEWSQEFKNLCQDIADEGTVAPYEYIAQVIDECLDVCKNLSPDHLSPLQSDLQEYKTKLHAGKAHLSFADDKEPQTRRHKIKKICKLCVGCLAVTGHLFVNGVEITSNVAESTNTTPCSDAVARFDGTSTTAINNAPLRALDVSGIQLTSPLLADDCLTGTLNLALIPKGTGALTTAIPDGTATGGNARGANAIDLQMVRVANSQVASGLHAVIAGGANNTASGIGATVGGGDTNNSSGAFFPTIAGGVANTASANASTVGGGVNSTASGNNSTVSGGNTNRASGENSTIAGGVNNAAPGRNSTISGGVNHIASGVSSTIGGGDTNNASGDTSTIAGGINNTTSGVSSTVSGGDTNIASGVSAAIGGGNSNTVSGVLSTIGGGNSNTASANFATIGGGSGNNDSADFSTIAGGVNNTASGTISTIAGGANNTASGTSSTVSGGSTNIASANFATIGGGSSNNTSGGTSTIAGGANNTASGAVSTIGGGTANTASNQFATIAGGQGNIATGFASMIPGGQSNIADGDFSFAAGLDAQATNTGSFVWADSLAVVFTSTNNNQFRVRATGGAQFITNSTETTGVSLEPAGSSWGSISDRNRKENFKEVDTVEVLNKLMSIPILSWNYKGTDESIRHIGPMAQDFNPAFDFNEAPLSITTLDFDGVALAAIQGLYTYYDQRVRNLENIVQQLVAQQQSMK